MPSRHEARSPQAPFAVAPIPQLLELLERSGAGGRWGTLGTPSLAGCREGGPGSTPSHPAAPAPHWDLPSLSAPLTEPSLAAGELGQRSAGASSYGIQLCLSPHGGFTRAGLPVPLERAGWGSQGQTQPPSAGSGQAPAAGPSEEEDGDGPSGAGRHLPRPSPPVLDASAFAGCCCPSPRGNDVCPPDPVALSSSGQRSRRRGLPLLAPLLSARLAAVIQAVLWVSGSSGNGHKSSLERGRKLRWAGKGSGQGTDPVPVAGGDTSRLQTSFLLGRAGRPWTQHCPLSLGTLCSAPDTRGSGCGCSHAGCGAAARPPQPGTKAAKHNPQVGGTGLAGDPRASRASSRSRVCKTCFAQEGNALLVF